MARLIALALAAALLAGCASAPGGGGRSPSGDLPPPEASAPPPPEAPPAPTEPPPRPDPSVSLALRTESTRAAAAGDHDRAMDLLERAIRIEPDRAELWLDLAELHLDRGDALRANQLLHKGAALAAGDRRLERRVRSLRERIAAAGATG